MKRRAAIGRNAAKTLRGKRVKRRRAPKAKGERSDAVLRTAMRSSTPSAAGLQAQVRTLTRQLSEALEQQTATAEILRVISRSLSDTQPAFDAIVQAGLALFQVPPSASSFPRTAK